MQINTNTLAINTIRMMSRGDTTLRRSMQRLSSGLRINSASDDAAGLAISERMATQVRGFKQAARNASDAVSLLQTAEGSLGEITNMLQRGRELALQAANATNGAKDRQSLQAEVAQLVDEINRIGTTSSFNGVPILGGGAGGEAQSSGGPDEAAQQKLDIIEALKRSWLQQGEALVQTYYGINADGADIDIQFVEGEDYLAAVSFTGYEIATGKFVGLTLNVDLDDFVPADWPNGGPSSVSNDRIIAHELTHAIMARSINMQALPLWFIEGSAEFIHGADDRLYGDISAAAGGSTAAKVQTLMDNYLTADGSVELYSAGYAALRYMHDEIIANGGNGLRDVFDYLRNNTLSTLDDALAAVAVANPGMAFNSVATLTPLFAVGQAGNDYITNLYDGGSLQNADTGAIGGADAQAGGTRDTSATGVVPDSDNYTENPLAWFNETFPTVDTTSVASLSLSAVGTLSFQIGANANQTMSVELRAVQASTLNIADIDLVTDPQTAIGRFDAAIEAIAAERARYGAVQNVMESTITSLDTMHENISASRSRVLDADYAIETSELVRSQIVHEAATSMLVQANAQPGLVLQLLG